MKWQASAPANIALIKYMGKSSAANNLPANISLSYTLEHLRSFVELELNNNLTQDQWEPLQDSRAAFIPTLNANAQQRYINHLVFIKKQFNFTGHFIIRSANNFPAGCGIASSAASFAALTLCAVNALVELTQREPLRILAIANLSRQGSGSSCRSLLGPWVFWQGQTVEAIELPYKHLHHFVVVITEQHKNITSSEAHQRVLTSPLYAGRIERAEQRYQQLIAAFNQQNWSKAYEIVWQEFSDMHALFETAAQPFKYIQTETQEVLDYLRVYWENNGDGPLVTLDAGPNVHVLFRDDQIAMFNAMKKEFATNYMIL